MKFAIIAASVAVLASSTHVNHENVDFTLDNQPGHYGKMRNAYHYGKMRNAYHQGNNFYEEEE
jgi:hypothetical protein